MKAIPANKVLINQDIYQNSGCIGNCGSADSKFFGFTFIELVLVFAIIGIITAIVIPLYIGHQERARVGLAISDLEAISLRLDSYLADHGVGPASLAEVNYDKYLDPWGNEYQYFNIKTAKGKGQMRKDRFLVPINTYYDLYSMGPDGQSVSPLTAKVSKDDIIRANDGGYFGPAEGF
jgi:general secretion pathway protein G